MFDKLPAPYAFTIRGGTTESKLPTITVAIRFSRIDGRSEDPEDKFDAVELLWDTRAHGTIVFGDLLSTKFRKYLTLPIPDGLQRRVRDKSIN